MTILMRRLLDTAALLLMGLGTLWGFGLLGNPVERTAGGALSADATLLAPATPAFSIWSVIYLGLFAYVAWQWLPAARHSGRADRIWWLAAVSMLLNGAWLLVTQVGWVWVSVVVIAALALALGELMARLSESPARTATEGVLLDGVFGLYLGWVSVATIANVTAALVASGVNPPLEQGQVWAIGILAVGALLGVVFALRLGGRISVAAAMAWAMVWIAVGRLTAAPASTVVGVVAVAAAAVILVAAVAVRGRRARIPAAGR